MKYINKKEFEKLNIIKWHEMGYTGKGIKIANMESGNPNAWNLKGRVLDPFNIKRNDTNNHADKVMDVILQVAPDSVITMLDTEGYHLPGGGLAGKFIEESLPYIDKHGIHLVNASLIGDSNKTLANKVNECKNKGTIFVTSAGNTPKYDSFGFENWITVSASHMSRNKEINIANYSSRGQSIDFTCFSGILVNNQKDKNYPIRVEGTSFASPLFTGMLVLVQQFFLEKTGRALYPDKLLQFAKDNSIDLGQKGRDNLFGNGLFVLPDPEDINIDKHMRKEDDIMKFSDIEDDRWSADNIELVNKLKLMEGYPDGTFNPTGQVTREELATVVANSIKLLNNK